MIKNIITREKNIKKNIKRTQPKIIYIKKKVENFSESLCRLFVTGKGERRLLLLFYLKKCLIYWTLSHQKYYHSLRGDSTIIKITTTTKINLMRRKRERERERENKDSL